MSWKVNPAVCHPSRKDAVPSTAISLTMNHRLLAIVAVCLLAVTCSGIAEAQNTLPKKQHRTSDAPFLSPPQAVKAMSIPSGFEVSVFAAEPDIAEPIAFTFDDRGRIWVVENMNYRTRRAHTDDPVTRIVILEDTDSDGVLTTRKRLLTTWPFPPGSRSVLEACLSVHHRTSVSFRMPIKMIVPTDRLSCCWTAGALMIGTKH